MDERTKLIELMHFYNPWWGKGVVSDELALPYERAYLRKLLSYLKINRVMVIKGPRRTGKSTLLYQMIKSLLKSGVSPADILYLSFDEISTRSSLDEIVRAYEMILKKPLSEFKDIYFFLDEIQFLDNWSGSVKKYFDMRSKIKFIVSGSSASLLRKGTESLAGRTVEEVILPFGFREYLHYNSRDEKLASLVSGRANDITLPADIVPYLPYRSRIKIVFDDYLKRGGFPHLFKITEETIFRKLLKEDVVEKVIYRDLVELFGVKKPLILEKLFIYLADISANILNVSHISSSLGLSREYVEKYLDYLKSAYLVFSLPKFTRSVESRIRSAEKVFMIDTALSGLSGDNKNIGYRVETSVAGHLFGRDVSYWKNNYEVDFVLRDKKQIMPIEVKYKNDIALDDMKGILNFMDKFRLKKGFILTRDLTKEIKIKGKIITCKPVWLALLQV
jgi:predicted AAA+ superfamily ATPase